MALTRVSDVLDGEVVARNESKGSIWLELDSGERALLPARRRASDFDSLVEGREITVKVLLVQDGNIPGKPFIIVSEYLDDEPEGSEDESEESGRSPGGSSGYSVSSKTVDQFPVGKNVKGKVERILKEGLLVSIAGGVLAVLAFTELAGSKKESFRPGVSVNAFVLKSAPDGIALTRRSEVAIAA